MKIDKAKIITIEKDGKVVWWYTQEAYDILNKVILKVMVDVEIDFLKSIDNEDNYSRR